MSFGFNNIFQRMRSSTADVANKFDGALDQSVKTKPAAPKPPAVAAPHGWNENPAGISQYRTEPGVWPFRIYDKAGIDPTDNKALHDQLVATPELDPKAFGNRPAAPADADKTLQNCDQINVLSPERLASLESQRSALKIASDNSKTQTERDTAKDDLVVAIAQEIDLATVGQGAPKLGNDKNNDKKVDVSEASDLTKPILERAPNDPVFVEAFNQARELKESKWKAEGRTDDQLGIIATAGDARDYDKVTSETKKQLVDLALAAGPSESEQITALSNRANIYMNFSAGEPGEYAKALQTGAEQAIKEIRVDRKVDELTSAFGKGDLAGAQAFMAKLREKTGTENTLPGSGSLLASDPKVIKMIDQSIDAISGAGLRDGDMKEKMQAVIDLSVASQNILYNDGDKPGKGKQVLDHIAEHIVKKMRSDLPGDQGNIFNQQMFFKVVSREDVKGGGTSLLAAISAHTAVETDKRKGEIDTDSDSYQALNSNAQWATRRSIENFGAAAKTLNDDIGTKYNELYHGLEGWNGNVKADTGIPAAGQLARDMEAIDSMSPENKEKSAKLVEAGNTKQKQWELQESIELGVKIYSNDNKKVDGQDNDAPIPMLFGTGIMMTKSKSVKEAMADLPERPKQTDDPYQNAETSDPKTPGTIWVQRATRALATQAVTESLKGGVKNINVALGENRYQSILADGSLATNAERKAMKDAKTLSPTADAYVRNAKAALGEARFNDLVDGKATATDAEKRQIATLGRLNFGLNAATRLSSGGSAVLFGRNIDALDGSPADLVYYVPHTLMMLTAAQTSLLPKSGQIFLDKGSTANTPAKVKIDEVKARIDASTTLTDVEKKRWTGKLNMLDGVRGGGVDTLYVAADLTNAVLNGFGWAGTKQDGVKSFGYGTATISDAMFATVAARGTDAALLQQSQSGLSRLLTRLGPLKVSGVAAVLQVAGAGIVGGRGAYNAAHTYDKADADAIQVLYGVKDRKTAEMLAEHNDLLDEGLMGILQTVFPGDEHLMGGDPATRSANNVLTETYADLDYNRARLGQLFNSWSPDQAKEVSETIRNMTAKDGKLADSQDDLKYLQLPFNPDKADLSKYPNIKYNSAEKRFEDQTTQMYWEAGKWWVPQKKVEPGMLPSQDPLWYDPAEGSLMHTNAFAKEVTPDSKEGLKAWLKNKGYID
ncbi:hypothetical protein [Phyllobacterium zundukense]|uniref:Uncharacterized protein n=1 Tax=Phyllobacterium zundukense TaxID=1867719 RepID=A0ACD4CXM5_9HYPH|nr:hypothetical protein [Phyllobacterium zundukense]UXN58314.1 hypothetical protein N8E88_05770 [Phyllobacterium zundukense]